MIVAGDFNLPPKKNCFESDLCPGARELCTYFCEISLGKGKSGECFGSQLLRLLDVRDFFI